MKAEREHYFDGGVEQRFNGGFKVGLDAYYKLKRNLLDEGQFGSALILSPFNYAKGYAWGVELSSNYTHGPIDLYANLARGTEKGKDIVSSQYFFAPEDLSYIHDHYIYTDHSQNWTASGGGSYTISNRLGTLVPTADFVYGSGLRTDDPKGVVPNGGKLPGYFVLNAGIAQNFRGPGALQGVTIRADVLNLFDRKYQLRSGQGVGVGAPQWGERRGLLRGGQQEVLIAIAAAGFGIISERPVGIIGAFIGSWLLHRLGITSAWVVRAIVNTTIGAILPSPCCETGRRQRHFGRSRRQRRRW